MSTFPANAAVNPESSKLASELEWGDLSVILAICRAGSLSGAARSLGHNHSTIFRKINAIEKKTGVRFFERLSDGYVMTDAGRTAMHYAERIESEVHALSREVLGQDMRLQGTIRVTAPEGFTIELAPALFADFLKQNPAVSIDIMGASSAVDLSRREADIAIRATPKPPDASLGKKIADFRFAVYATPEYAKAHRGIPLAEQKWCCISGVVDWLVPLIWKKKEQGEEQTVYSSANSTSVLNAAAEGIGCTLMPCYLADVDDRLVRVVEPFEQLKLEFWILTHPVLRHTARVKALMAYLYDRLVKDADLYAGERVKRKSKIMFKL